jgi:hypothetical protein
MPPEYQPAAIRDGLIEEDRAEFVAAYHDALVEGQDKLDLHRLFTVLAHFGAIAALTRRLGAEEYQRTGRHVPAGSITAAELGALVGERLVAASRA